MPENARLLRLGFASVAVRSLAEYAAVPFGKSVSRGSGTRSGLQSKEWRVELKHKLDQALLFLVSLAPIAKSFREARGEFLTEPKRRRHIHKHGSILHPA